MKVLATGGAGYIGSVLVKKLCDRGDTVIVVDNLAAGSWAHVDPRAHRVRVDIRSHAGLQQVFHDHDGIEGVYHLAAEPSVEVSMKNPELTFGVNVQGSLNLLRLMRAHDVPKIVFTSSSSVYGDVHRERLKEDLATEPVSAYGQSKLMVERVLDWYGEAYGLQHVSLRCFNVCGAMGGYGDGSGRYLHVIPIMLDAAVKGQTIRIFGDDYPTQDGTCVRDYVHVEEVAGAHIAAMEKVDTLGYHRAFNVGSGQGSSVIDVLDAVRRVTGEEITVEVAGRRTGDTAFSVADTLRASIELEWAAAPCTLVAIVRTAWDWMRGYGELGELGKPPVPKTGGRPEGRLEGSIPSLPAT